MFAWDNEDVKVLLCLHVASGWTWPGPKNPGAEEQRSSFWCEREARVAAQRLSAPWPTIAETE